VGGGAASCPACGHPNRDGARFCAGCGSTLAAGCPSCGAELPQDARFCDSCGSPVGGAATASSPSAAATAPSPAAPAGVRKVVTIVFADLSGSTALEERMDPESVRTVMQRYYALIRDVVEARDGRVVKFIGDGVMAVFGVPDTREDDARRALDASLAMHDAFGGLAADVARDRGAAISLRVGVNTGEVVVDVADDDVVGDAVNLAARLEHAAAPGRVLVGESTWRLTRAQATFEDVRELHVAGKSEKVRARLLVAMQHELTDVRTELVGRGREVETMRAVFDDVVKNGAPRVVTVLGSPGVGKTRLGSELERIIEDEATVLVARCTQQTSAPLAPIADVLHAAAMTSTGDSTTTVERLGALLPDGDSDRDRVVRTLTSILGSGAGATPEETLWALRRLLEQLARVQPVVLVVDDLQWGEAMLLDLVEHLGEWTRGPLLLVVLARPELRDRRGALTDGGRHTVLALEGLDRAATAQLACDLLAADALPSELLDRLPASTGGNPLFLRELLRMLVDDEVLHADADGRWGLAVAPDAIDVPPTIQSLLAARLDRLSPDEQVVLERAAIWGTEFPMGALVELLPLTTRARANAVIEQLRRKELVESDGTYWIDEPVYRFHHVLIRDAAYRRMLRDARASLHETIASWADAKTTTLEAEYDELVGHHLEQAYVQRRELGPLDDHTIAVGRQASARLGAAAQRALDRDDPSAAPLASRALDCLPSEDAARADLLLVLCDALLSAADAVAARTAVAELELVAASSPRLSAWAACFAAQLATLIDPAHLRETERRASEVAAELAELGDARGAAKAHAVHAAALARLGRFAEVEEALDRALTRAREAGDRRLATVALAAAPVAAVWGPSPVPRAGGRCLDVVRLLRITAGSPVVEATSLRCQAVLEAFRGRVDAARRLVASARATLEELGLVHGLLEAELFAGIVELGAGDLDAASALLARAHDGLRRLGADADAARAGALLARVELEQGRLDEAERLAREAELLAGDDLQAGIAWRRVEAEVLARRGEHAEARALADAAVAIASRTDALVQHADACLGLAAVRRAAGDHTGAAQAAREAAELYDRKGATALAELARAALDAPRAAATPTATPTRSSTLRNRATDVFAEWARRFADADLSSGEELVTEDFSYEDRRPISRVRHDRVEAAANVRLMREEGANRVSGEPIAVRGDRLVLMRAVTNADDEIFVSDGLALYALAPDGRLAAAIVFATDDLDDAIAELDRRYVEGEGAPYAEMLTLMAESNRAFNARDIEALASTYAAAIDQVDSLTAGWGSMSGRDDMLALATDEQVLADDAHAIIECIHAVSVDAAVVTTRVTGTTPDGRPIERSAVLVEHRAGSAFDRVETFAPEHLDDALAAFRRLQAATAEPTNRAAAAYMRWAGLFARREWDAMRGLVTEGFAFDDRRPVLRQHIDGPVELRHLQEVADVHGEQFHAQALATRGQRLALLASRTETTTEGAARFSSESLLVVEIDDVDALVAVVVLPSGDLDDAVEELDRRYLEGEGAPHARPVVALGAAHRAYNACDWGRFRDCFEPDGLIVDHRPVSWGTIDVRVDGVLEDLQNPFVSDVRMWTRSIHAASADVLLASVMLAGHDAEGAPIETPQLVLVVIGPNAMARNEVFPPEALDVAFAAYQRLVSVSAEPANRASEAHARLMAAMEVEDWDALRDIVVPDVLYDDRRPIVRSTSRGDDALALAPEFAQQGIERVVTRVLATRGDRLALIAARGEAADPDAPDLFSGAALGVTEVDDAGRITAKIDFALEDVDAAVAELDRRHLEGEGAAHAEMLALTFRAMAAYNAADWDALAACYAADVEFVDEHFGGWGTRHGRSAALEYFKTTSTALGRGHALIRSVEVCSHDTILVTMLVTSNDAEAPAEILLQQLFHRAGSEIDRAVGFYAADEADAARAEYERLTAPRAPLTNRCTEVVHELCDLFDRRDWDVVVTRFAPAYLGEDRRRGLEAFTEMEGGALRVIFDIGVRRIDYRPIAVRGERLALGERVFRGERSDADSWDVATLAVVELDEHGRVAFEVIFDPDNLDAAVAELERRYVAGEGAPYTELWQTVVRNVAAVNARDWDAMRRGLTDDFVSMRQDHGGWDDQASGDEYIASLEQMMAIIPDARIVIEQIRAISTEAVACSVVVRSGGADASIELAFQALFKGSNGRLERGLTFDASDGDRALLAYEQLVAAPRDALSNRCTEVYARFRQLFAARDWPAMREIIADDFVFDDRLPVVGMEHSLRDSARNTRLLAEQGARDIDATIIAIRGQRLALASVRTAHGPDGGEIVSSDGLSILALGVDGRFKSITQLPRAELQAAFDELDRQYIAGEGAPCSEMLELVCRGVDAYNRGDWDAFAACYAPNVQHRDGYPAEWRVRVGRDAVVQEVMRGKEIFPSGFGYTRSIVACSQHAALSEYVMSVRNADGTTTDLVHHMLHRRSDALIDHIDIYGGANVDAALAAFHELSREAARLPNRCIDAFRRLAAAINARDEPGVAVLFAPGFVIEEHRRGMIATGEDPVADTRLAQQLGLQTGSFETIAVRGERLALAQWAFVGAVDDGGDIESAMLSLNEVDAEGQFVWGATYDVDDLGAAIADLEWKFIEGEGAPYARILRLVVASNRARDARDWDAYRSCFDPDVVTVDRYSAGWGNRHGIDDLIALSHHTVGTIDDSSMVMTEIESLSAESLLCSLILRGRGASGDQTELGFTVRFHLGPRGIDLVEALPSGRADGPAPPGAATLDATRLENRATAAEHRIGELFGTGDLDAIAACFAPDYLQVEHRRGIVLGGEVVESIRIALELGVRSGEYEPIAIRGEWLSLGRHLYRGTTADGGAFENAFLQVQTVDEHDRFVRTAVFDVADLDLAVEILDEWYVAGEGAPFADVWRIVAHNATVAYNSRDWETFRAAFAPSVVIVDHRPAGWGSLPGVDAQIEALCGFIELVPDARTMITAVRHMNRSAVVYSARAFGHETGGGEVELAFHLSMHIGPNGIEREEMFPPDALDAALASVAARTEMARNRCTMTGDRLCELFAARDWAAFATIFAPDFDGDDFRRGFTSFDADPVKSFGLVAELGGASTRLELRPVAIRGDSLALSECWLFNEYDTQPGIFLTEVAPDGQFIWMAAYDGNDLERAIRALDARYAAGEAASCAGQVAVVGALIDAYNARDWARYRALYRDDAEIVDHRPVSLGAIPGVDVWVEWAKALLDVNPTFRVRIRTMRAALGTVLIELDGSSDDDDGGVVTDELVVVIGIANERVARYELFTIEAREAAAARFAALSESRARPADGFDNECMRVNRDAGTLLGRRDLAGIGALCASDIVYDDRRRGLGVRSDGRDAYIGMLGIVDGFDDFSVEFVPMATRGERNAMWRVIYVGVDPQPDVIDLLVVGTIDASACIASLVVFDPDDVDAAYAALEEQYLADEGAPHADVWMMLVAWRDAFNRRDWGTMGRINDRDLVFVDHNLVGYGTGLRAHLRDLGEAFVAATPDVYLEFHAIVAINGLGALVRTSSHATNAGGGQFGAMAWQVLGVRAGKISSIDIFPPTELDAARTRFAELVSPSEPKLEPNAAFLAVSRATDAVAAADSTTYESLFAPDVRTDDRRRGVASQSAGFDHGHGRMLRDATDYTLDLLATRGDALSLHRGVYRGQRDSGFAWEYDLLVVTQLGSEGRVEETVWFDSDDIDTAVTELDARYVDGLSSDGAEAAAVWATVARWNDGFNRRDRVAADGAAAPDMAYEDHRAASYGTLDRDGVMDLARAIVDVTPDARIHFVEIGELRAHGVVARAVIETEHNPAGGFNSTTWWLLIVREDLIRRLETFAVEDRAAAQARLAELAR
jgi:class 3 adenylate cyclase